ncbi:uncharacterized protein [Malus domestica]|uniref:uncharacterized protein isoform X2 n=1 Tax=Malus domestica TaxID=3750 RepID=UPI0039770BBB
MMVSANTARFGVLVKFPGRGVSSKLFVLEPKFRLYLNAEKFEKLSTRKCLQWLPSLTSTTESLFAFPLSPVLSLFLISIEFFFNLSIYIINSLISYLMRLIWFCECLPNFSTLDSNNKFNVCIQNRILIFEQGNSKLENLLNMPFANLFLSNICEAKSKNGYEHGIHAKISHLF